MSYRYWKNKIESFIKKVWTKEVQLEFVLSGWPWWQHVNKVATKVQLHRDISKSLYIPEPYLTRCIQKNQQYITDEWILRLDTSVHRTQKANKDQTYKKLRNIIISAFKEPTVRKKSIVPQRAVDRRIAQKKRRSRTRSTRRKIVG